MEGFFIYFKYFIVTTFYLLVVIRSLNCIEFLLMIGDRHFLKMRLEHGK